MDSLFWARMSSEFVVLFVVLLNMKQADMNAYAMEKCVKEVSEKSNSKYRGSCTAQT